MVQIWIIITYSVFCDLSLQFVFLLGFIEYILYSSQNSINKLDLHDYESRVLINELPNAVAIDIDIEQGMIYWTDIAHDSVQRAKIGTNNNTFEIVIQFNLESPEGIAIDWIGRKVYWTDRTPGKIEVSELDGRNRAVLVNENIKTPRAIAVHPRYRYFYTYPRYRYFYIFFDMTIILSTAI